MKHLIIIITLLIAISSCYHENIPEAKPPENLLSEAEMVNILTDIYLAEGTIAYQKTRKELAEGAGARYYELIFEKYHIDHRILKDNMNYYNTDPKNMEILLEKVLANLSKLQSEVESAALADSLNKQAIDSANQILRDSLQILESDTLLTLPSDSLNDNELSLN